MITKDNLRNVLAHIGYTAQDNPNAEVWHRSFNDKILITVDFTAKCIHYPLGLKVHRDSVKNFSTLENFVVLECITRLLSLGYTPSQIELEKPMPGGRGDTGGFCDILVKNNEGDEFLLIECKTPDSTASNEFSRAWHRMQEDGGQLFNYFNSYRKAKALCLYTSDWQGNLCSYSSYIVSMEDNEDYLRADSRLKGYLQVAEERGGKEAYFKVWKDTYDYDYSTVGIFEEGIQPFSIGKRVLTVADLKDADGLEIQKKYHEYATIMRQHNVSGRENAFDKLVNLYLAKIVDEAQHPDNLQFYWRGATHDDYYSLQDRLQQMYSHGMKEFLGEEVTYIDNQTIADSFYLFRNDPDATKDRILDYFRQLKFYTNNDFAFLDVHNQGLFRQNAEILKKVVLMLQDIRLRTDKHNQFLGDLFEGFLDQGVKQSEGQFFTPMPIVRFIISSLPLEEINNEDQIPKVIDYACGAGHFLNEYAEQVKNIIGGKINEMKPYYSQIYGIEKEYRLSKVAKVSAFMYGQDNINIIYQDALRPHPEIQDGSFSVLIANPPYSVKGFLETLSEEERAAFTLTQYVSDLNANNCIELFFIERAAQLLKPGGIAAIILPSSILSNVNDKIYTRARAIILEQFQLICVVDFASGTFGKTGTNTVTLFLRKREEPVPVAKHYRNRVQTWFKGDFSKDPTFEDNHMLNAYCEMQGIRKDLYTSLLGGKPEKELWEHELFKAYRTKYASDREAKRIEKKRITERYTEDHKATELENYIAKSVRTIEKEKLYYYLLAQSSPQPVLIVKSLTEKAAIKRFLGYEWSTRKGNEGIKYLNSSMYGEDGLSVNKGIDSIQTPLFNPSALYNPAYINSLVRSYYQGKPLSISDTLSPYCSEIRMEDMIDFKRTEFDLGFYTNRKQSTRIQSKYPLITMGKLVPHIESGSRPKGGVANILEGALSLGGEHIDNTSGYLNMTTPKYVPDSFFDKAQRGRVSRGDILICKDGALTGKVAIVRDELDGIKAMVNEHVYVLRCKEPTTQHFLFNFLFSPIGSKRLKEKVTGSAQGGLNSTNLNSIQIPLPPLSVQEQIIAECNKVDEVYESSRMAIVDYRARIRKVFTDLEVLTKSPQGGGKIMEMRNICFLNSDKVSIESIDSQNYISTENLLQNKQGYTPYAVKPNINKVTAYQEGDVLVSNIRPYLKKIWLADRDGGCSNDVLVFRLKDSTVIPQFFYYSLAQDTFFDYVMQGAKGIKMPRGDKAQIMNYAVVIPSTEQQRTIVNEIDSYEFKIAEAQAIMDSCPERKSAIINKYLCKNYALSNR